jgi:hypothetical protein
MYSPYADPSILFAILLIVLFMLVPSALVSGFITLLFCLLDRIRSRRVQIAIVLAAGIVFIVGERPFHVFVYTSLGANELMLLGSLFSLVDMIPQAFILGTGVLVSFLLIRDHLLLKRAWAGLFVAGTIAITIDFLKNFMTSMGSNPGGTSEIYSIPYIDVIGRTSEVLLIFVIASAVFGAFIFLRHTSAVTAGHKHRKGILAAVAIGLLVTTPAAAAGGLAVYIATLFSNYPKRLAPMLLSLATMIVFGIGGSLLMGVSGMERAVDIFIIPTIVMAFAAVIPFVYCAPAIPKTWQPVILLAGTAAADLALSAIAIFLDLGNRLTADPLTILTFAEGGIIFAALAFVLGKYVITRHDRAQSLPVAEEAP